MDSSPDKKRDFLDWIGVAADFIHVIAFVAGVLGLLYWYASTKAGLPALVVGITVVLLFVLVAVVCLAIHVVHTARAR